MDEIGDFTKAISRKVGQGVGAVKGAGQKVKGVAQRSVAALGNAYTQGQTGAQKKVAGQDYKAPAAKQTPAQGQTPAQVQTPAKAGSTAGGVLGNLAKNVGNVALDTAAGSGYDYKQGVNPNPILESGRCKLVKQHKQQLLRPQVQQANVPRLVVRLQDKLVPLQVLKKQRDARCRKKR